jgi:hypothetical protein
MDNPLAPWRDLSIAWMALLTGIAFIAPAVVLFFAQLYLRRFNRWLRTMLLHAHVWALRIEQGTTRTCERIVHVPITLSTMTARVSTTTSGVINFLRGQ